jgi:3',5'-cyclic AMP phosphodiesterase CpdA
MRILHLSDLHYGRRDASHSAHAWADTKGTPKPEVLVNVLAPVIRERQPDAIVVSGDVGWSGIEDDYNFAYVFLDSLRQSFGVSIVIAPGNHDVDWSVPHEQGQDKFIAFLQRFYGAAFQRTHVRHTATDPRRRQRLSSLYRLGDDRLTILTVNSAAGEGPSPEVCPMCANPKHRLPPVLVDPATLTAWEPDLGQRSNELRILVVHHHLFPFKENPEHDTSDPEFPEDKPDRTIIANSARLQSWLSANKFSVVLHGHKHRAHVRHDLLASRNDDQLRDILVLGAGSAGVFEGERGADNPLSFNVVEATPLREGVFNIAVDTYRIDTVAMAPAAHLDTPHIRVEVGRRNSKAPLVFHARSVPECYDAVAATTRGNSNIHHNFISIVDTPTFSLPRGVKFRDQDVTIETIHQSFITLHPEYDEQAGAGWASAQTVRKRLEDQPQRFRFLHGNRLFAIPATITPHGPTQLVHPLEEAIKGIGSSRAYVGLYNAFLDAKGGSIPPPPCLVGLQFQLDRIRNVLNVVATFRKIELSFWWLVNMYEMELLLKYASSQHSDRPSPGTITFYASLAQWKADDPGPTFSAKLDDLPTTGLVQLGLELSQGANSLAKKLLIEKRAVSNEDNIDERGLVALTDVLAAFVGSATQGKVRTDFVAELRTASQHLNSARARDGAAKTHAVLLANTALDNALSML